jgi:hypothetical protein
VMPHHPSRITHHASDALRRSSSTSQTKDTA